MNDKIKGVKNPMVKNKFFKYLCEECGWTEKLPAGIWKHYCVEDPYKMTALYELKGGE